jgi:hypothetical protein
MEKHKLNIPTEEFLPNSDMKMSFVFTGDEAYPLLKILLKHYAHKHVDEEKEVFNKKVSTARKTVKCSFGILTME